MTHGELLHIIDELDITDNKIGDYKIVAETVDGNYIGGFASNNTDQLEHWSHEVNSKHKSANFSLQIS